MLRELQSAFRSALLGGDEGALLARFAEDRIPAARRFAAYRTNVVASLVGTLEAAFPATATHAGQANFRFAASRFALAQPPREARLLAYGADFPAWLANFRPAQEKPWLAELARLEWARNEALFAADAEPLLAAALASLPPEQVPGLRFALHPSVRLLTSDFPLLDLWSAAQADDVAAAEPARGCHHILIQRPAFAVQQFALDAGAQALLAAFAAGATLAEAAETALAAAPGLDLQQALFAQLMRGSLAAVQLP